MNMRTYILSVAWALCLSAATNASAASINFLTAPFAGSDALTTPGRQVVGNEIFTDFDIANDLFTFDAGAFGVNSILFANDVVGNLPSSGINTVVLQTFDNDNDTTTPFGAGTAANLIAGQITAPGPGFFMYFNSGLDRARLVYSTNLDDNTADLKILARFENLSGQFGRDAFPLVSSQNFAINNTAPIPEPATMSLMALAGLVSAARHARRRRARR
jgi:hypothetical protein